MPDNLKPGYFNQQIQPFNNFKLINHVPLIKTRSSLE
jgi:hypothetical protein